MTWTRLSDDYPDRPDLLLCSRSARLLHVEALVYCNRHLTNGLLPASVLRRISDSEDPQADADELEAAGLWVRTDERSWQIDWADQEDADDVRVRQADSALRSRRRRRHMAGDHELCLPKHCASAVTRDAQRDAHSDDKSESRRTTRPPVPPSPPDPSRPEGPGRREGGERAVVPGRCPHNYPLDSEGDTGCPDCTAAVYAGPRIVRAAE